MTKRMYAVLLALTMLITVMPFHSAFAAETRVTRCNLLLRAKASTDSDAYLTIPGGTEITVEGTSGGWTKTTYNGHTGYVSTNHLMELTRSGYYPLKEGDNNPHVNSLQTRLAELGFYSGRVDGKYERSTADAVRAFQKANGIAQDGMAGGETQRIMYGDEAKSSAGVTAAQTAAATTTAATTTTASSDTLKLGSRGDGVLSLQKRLIELGYLTGTADGVFGTTTEKAVTDFQKRSSLSADGKAGKVTQNLLYSNGALRADGTIASSAVSGAGDYSTLKRGMTSDAVKSLQTRLKELGYLSASATGFYGTQTVAAVKTFQSQHNLTSDGIAGSATQVMLFGGSAQKAGSATVLANQTYDTLKEGMKSSSVTTMQKKLKELGYLSASATGYFGSETKKAVVAFQKNNNLTADGVAGSATLNQLYNGGTASVSGGNTTGTGKISGPSTSNVQLLHWFNQIKPSLKTGSTLQVYDPATGYGWKLNAISLGRHCDSEPLSAEDTLYMNAAFGNKTTWSPKIVYIKLPSGSWTMATMHNTPHLSGTIKTNNFDGHLCVHFLRDMSEAQKNDPNYGVQNQKALRVGWKALTGITVE